MKIEHYMYVVDSQTLRPHLYIYSRSELNLFIVDSLTVHCDSIENSSFSVGNSDGRALFINFNSQARATEILKYLQTTEILFI